MTKRIKKGETGYLKAQKKRAAVRTLLLFGLSAAVYLTGLFSTGTNQNLLTIVAVLGCLPASRSAVNLFVLLRCHGVSAGDWEQIYPHTGRLRAWSDLVFTSYEKNFEIHHMAYARGSLTGYTANSSCDLKACEKHLHSMCAQNGLSNVEIKIFRELPSYLRRLDALSEGATAPKSDADEQADRLESLLMAISL